MHLAAATAALLAVSTFTARAEPAVERDWEVQASGGCLLRTQEAPFGWRGSGAVQFARDARPWLRLGVEAGLYEYAGPPPQAYERYLLLDRSYLFSLAAEFSAQIPVHSGVAPFVFVQTGAARLALSFPRGLRPPRTLIHGTARHPAGVPSRSPTGQEEDP